MSGEELKKIIVDKGFKLANLAQLLGITPQALNRRLSVKAVKIDFVKEIEKALKVNLSDCSNETDFNDTTTTLLRLLQKKDEQIDRLINLLENRNNIEDMPSEKANVG